MNARKRSPSSDRRGSPDEVISDLPISDAKRLGDLRDYWFFYAAHDGAVWQGMRTAAEVGAEWSPLVDQALERQPACRALQRAAILDHRWQPYLDTLRELGDSYARGGVDYFAWFGLLGAFRDSVRKQLVEVVSNGEDSWQHVATRIEPGLDLLLDIAHRTIAGAYLAAKEDLLADREDRYRSMFDNSPMPMWMFDRETLRFVAVNEAAVRQYGYSRDEFSRLSLVDLRPAEDVASFKEDVRQARGLGESRRWRHLRKDGSIIIVEIRANDYEFEGRPVRLVVANDVTEAERAEQTLRKTRDQLRQAQKLDAIGRLAGGVAHDFNNVLTVIEGYASLLEDGFDAADARREDATEIRRAAERAAAITRQLLTLSRHGIVNPRSVDVSELVGGFVPMLRRLVGERVAIVTHLSEVPPVVADPGQLEQVLMNLAVNARDAMPEGGRLTVETEVVTLDAESAALRGLAPGRYVALAVTDTGTGIAPEDRGRIFDPFFTTKEAGKGTGLGLSIVHGIVTQAGGNIRLYSEVGHGTTFRVHLPVNGQTVPVPEVSTVTVAPGSLGPLTVLVVDDDLEVRGLAARVLRDAGCQVIEAASGEEAMEVCVRHEGAIDLAVLDIVLPDAQGDALIHQLRELRPSLAMVLMSGYPAGALSPQGGAPPNLLAKPFSPAELRAAAAGAVGLGSEDAAGGAAPVPAPGGGRRVLLADDDPHLRRALSRILRNAELEVVEVESGAEAAVELARRTFDVILSDVHMPGGGGLELLRAVRRVDLDVPVILMTGMPDVATAAEAVEQGAFRYLTKPIAPDALARTVHHAARAHALARLRREALSVSGGVLAGAADRAGLEVRFDQAIDGLWMAYQPIVEATSGALFGVEALVRSHEPSLPNPHALLEAAAHLGRLSQLGRRVRELSAGDFADADEPLVLFVNLHPSDLVDGDLVDRSAALTKLAGRVVLEVTERGTLDDTPDLVGRLARLRELGFRLAVDDIGAGYSGLKSFTDLGPEFVKIDMSLIRGIHLSALRQRTVEALCRLCHENGCVVVGEGVETLDERDTLIALGCDLLQGFLLGRPSPRLPS